VVRLEACERAGHIFVVGLCTDKKKSGAASRGFSLCELFALTIYIALLIKGKETFDWF